MTCGCGERESMAFLGVSVRLKNHRQHLSRRDLLYIAFAPSEERRMADRDQLRTLLPSETLLATKNSDNFDDLHAKGFWVSSFGVFLYCSDLF